MNGLRSNNSDDNSNKDDGLRMNEDDSVITPKAPKNAKMSARVKREASAKSDEESLLLINSASPRGGSR
jgi:hypothetical protein